MEHFLHHRGGNERESGVGGGGSVGLASLKYNLKQFKINAEMDKLKKGKKNSKKCHHIKMQNHQT